jgi:hypothetical protein
LIWLGFMRWKSVEDDQERSLRKDFVGIKEATREHHDGFRSADRTNVFSILLTSSAKRLISMRHSA